MDVGRCESWKACSLQGSGIGYGFPDLAQAMHSVSLESQPSGLDSWLSFKLGAESEGFQSSLES